MQPGGGWPGPGPAAYPAPAPPAWPAQAAAPHRREPALVILLAVVTLGVYWFVWLYRAFAELARQRRTDWHPVPILSAMIGLWLGYWVINGIEAARAGSAILLALRAGREPTVLPLPWLHWLDLVRVIAFDLLQMLYLRRGLALLDQARGSIGLVPKRVFWTVIALTAADVAHITLNALQQTVAPTFMGDVGNGSVGRFLVFSLLLGGLGSLALVAFVVFSILLVVMAQNGLNEFWQTTVAPPAAMATMAPVYAGPAASAYQRQR